MWERSGGVTRYEFSPLGVLSNRGEDITLGDRHS
jgi:hypothetical protein